MDSKQGRPSKYTPEIHAGIVEAISAGNYREPSSQAHGICPKTFYNWLSRGKKGEEPFLQFLHDIKRAEAQAELDHIRKIGEIARGEAVIERKVIKRAKRDGTSEEEVIERFSQPQWTAYAWLLERRHAMRWGKLESEKLTEMERRLKELERQAAKGGTNGHSKPAAASAEASRNGHVCER
jgi:hypothetical protein